MLRFAVTAIAITAASATFAQDAANGERVFRKCRACHQVGPEATNRVGPILNGIVGREQGAAEGFRYSRPMTELAEEGGVWTAEELDLFLTKPREYLRGTTMAFAGLRKEEDRADVIAYLGTFGADGNPAEETASE